ncbi:hypothetical protein L226DRAFT_568356 [Lentinus tigrinus ALCF2SS1-7]|uniref:BTB domain-containing protein n=1 Tax=Lentinus tigrinus ALCF2SS1-6 TaxID=1328759 RepID=A0A5C2S2A2_9APHY|nr:hypothetical protein L227DRAFT_613567 [Lentinus tigrinus ALCF2SS1-6]RPD78758.1 hypothetical protein L226DRAFT_568356 [Lentinus tigrinus ALCF2SS1-7]
MTMRTSSSAPPTTSTSASTKASKASSVFRDVLALPNGEEHEVAPPVIALDEDAQTLEHLFRLCYPVERPDASSLDILVPVLRAADKYHIPHALAALKKDLASFVRQSPLRVYAIAYIYKFEDVARMAARTLLCAGPTFAFPRITPPEMEMLPASALSRLLKYRWECVQAALVDTIRDESEPEVGAEGTPRLNWVWLEINSCKNGLKQCERLLLKPGEQPGRYYVPRWFADYIELVRKNLAVRPVGSSVAADHPKVAACVRQVSTCTTCGAVACADLWEFSKALAEKVDEAVSQIKLDFPPYFEE